MPLPMPLEPPTTRSCLPLKSSSFIAPPIVFGYVQPSRLCRTRPVDIAMSRSSFLPKWSGATAHLDQEKRHDGLDPAASSAFFRRGLRGGFATAADAARGRRY